MIGGCLTSGKYNMTGKIYAKLTIPNPNTGQVKAHYDSGTVVPMIARGLSNLRGKDSGTLQDWGNRLNEYHYLRVKTMTKFNEGDLLVNITDSNGRMYGDEYMQFIVVGVTPTYDPFGSFLEYDVLCNKSQVTVKLVDIEATSGDGGQVVGG